MLPLGITTGPRETPIEYHAQVRSALGVSDDPNYIDNYDVSILTMPSCKTAKHCKALYDLPTGYDGKPLTKAGCQNGESMQCCGPDYDEPCNCIKYIKSLYSKESWPDSWTGNIQVKNVLEEGRAEYTNDKLLGVPVMSVYSSKTGERLWSMYGSNCESYTNLLAWYNYGPSSSSDHNLDVWPAMQSRRDSLEHTADAWKMGYIIKTQPGMDTWTGNQKDIDHLSVSD